MNLGYTSKEIESCPYWGALEQSLKNLLKVYKFNYVEWCLTHKLDELDDTNGETGSLSSDSPSSWSDLEANRKKTAPARGAPSPQPKKGAKPKPKK